MKQDFRDFIFSVATGLILGILLHYLMYRFSIPGKPFIYVAF